ncbi:50S ribosomal protein L25 [Acetivibrio clariflavus]|uniref:50S ribosomal protein L25 n=1 Tax=Acetivibrio clariflavus TaxID=288965 RepID=UPI00048103ED|nr:50S ribosomal protein L25 [Acetivibrio clariflavus]
MTVLLNATERKEKAKKVRCSGYVPGSMYGPGLEKNIEIQIKENEINKFLKSHSIGAKTKIKVNGTEQLCVVKDIQYDAVSNKPIHIEFYASSEDRLVKSKVPIKFKGNESLSNRNLVLNILKDEVELQGKLKDLPEFIEVDVSSLDDGSIITMRDIALPEGVRLLSREDETAASVTVASTLAS